MNTFAGMKTFELPPHNGHRPGQHHKLPSGQRAATQVDLEEQRLVTVREMTLKLIQCEHHERERLAQVLHDDLQQLLVGAKYPLRIILKRSSDDTTIRSVETIEMLLNKMIETSRLLVSDLHPAILHQSGLDAALIWLAERMKKEQGLEVETAIQARIPDDRDGIVTLLFQAARELLFNVVKHANVSKAYLELCRSVDNLVQVSVRDEGVGFDCNHQQIARGTGMGLFGWRERLELIGGKCLIESAPGQGTRVTLIAPALSPVAAVGSLTQ